MDNQFENHVVSAAWQSTGGSRIFFLHIEHNVLILPPTVCGSLKALSSLEFQNVFPVRAYF